MRLVAAATAALLSFASVPAGAAVIDLNLTFSAIGQGVGPQGRPPAVPVVMGAIRLTFDDTVTTASGADGFAGSINIPVDGPLGFSYYAPSPGFTDSGNFVTIGGLIGGAGLLAPGASDFVLFLNFRDINSRDSNLFYFQRETGSDFYGTTGLTFTTATAVPEPASLALFGSGLLGLGLVRRRRV